MGESCNLWTRGDTLQKKQRHHDPLEELILVYNTFVSDIQQKSNRGR